MMLRTFNFKFLIILLQKKKESREFPLKWQKFYYIFVSRNIKKKERIAF